MFLGLGKREKGKEGEAGGIISGLKMGGPLLLS